MPHADRLLPCRECGSSFTFTAGEQAFYLSRGLAHEPGRCPGCRTSRKDGSPLGGGFVTYGPFASFGGREARQMHPAVCTQCGQQTEVPFVPSPDRPVYCSECFRAARQRAV